MKFRPILYLCILSFWAINLSAQGIGALGHMPTPHATDLGRFGDFSMSYYTGNANVTIPIHSFTQRGITLDISLTYDTSGLPVNKLPGWVGPGWTLNAGGVITRLRKNYCDEMTFVGSPFNDNFSNYFNSYSNVASDGTPNTTYLCNYESCIWHDFSPDIFYFSFMGKTGSFFLGTDGEWKMSCNDNLVVEFDHTNLNNFIAPIFPNHLGDASIKHPYPIKGFAIYDDEGNQYYFGGNNDYIEYSTDLFHTSNEETVEPWVATAWYLKSIKDRNGQLLYSFSYERGNYLVQLYKTPFPSQNPAFSGTLNLPLYPSSINIADEEYITFAMESPYQAGRAARALYPSVYNGPDGSPKSLTPGYTPNSQKPFFYLQSNRQDVLQFNVLPAPDVDDPLSGMDIKFLKEIRVNPLSEQTSITYKLEYDSLARYHLTSLTAEDYGGPAYKHSFKYYNYGSLTPDYLTDQHDFWGYYNEPYSPGSGGGYQPGDPYIHEDGEYGEEEQGLQEIPVDSIRKPNLAYSKMGMLQEIIFPTGGKTVFDYELNDYSIIQTEEYPWIAQEHGTAGGLRIKSITEYEDSAGSTATRQRLFSYVNPYTGESSGQLMENEGQPVYYEIRRGNTLAALSVPAIPLGTTLGTHIGYSYVTETVDDVMSRRLHFTNFTNAYEGEPNVYLPAQNEMDPSEVGNAGGYLRFCLGKLLDETITDGDANIVCKTAYKYRTDTNVLMQQFSFGFNNILYLNTSPESLQEVSNQMLYRLYYPKYDIERIIQSTAHGNAMVCDTTFLTMTTYDQLMNDWEIKPYFRKCSSERIVRGNSSFTKDYSYTTFSNYFLPQTSVRTSENSTVVRTDEKQYALYNNKPQLKYEITRLANGPADTLVTYFDWDINGRLNSFARKGEHTTHLFWKPYSDHLLASVTGPFVRSDLVCPAQGLNYSGGPLNVIQTASGGQSIFNIPDVRAATYLYDKHGCIVSSATGNGQVTYYFYDGFGRLTEIQDADHNTLQRFTYNYSTSQAQ